MPQKYMLGLTRNRLFEFDNAVVFGGKYKEKLDILKAEKALKALAIKAPVITGAVELQGEDAFICLNKAEINIFQSEKSFSQIKEDYSKNGVDFGNRLFEFQISSDNFLVIASHTAVCDSKSLLWIGMSFSNIYRMRELTFKEEEIYTFSKLSELPADVVSPLTDKISAELDEDWQKHKKIFSYEDYEMARKVYLSKKKPCGEVRRVINSEELNLLKDYCRANKVDLSSLIAFSLYESMLVLAGGSKRYNKIHISADRRYFFNESQKYTVGAYSGFVETSLSPKEQRQGIEDKLKSFQMNCYKGVTSSFRTFYDDILLMKVSPSYSDSAFMYMSGIWKNKASRKLAENYSCLNSKLCEFCSYNLDQEYWKELKDYDEISVYEPFKSRYTFSLSFLVNNGEGLIELKYNTKKCTKASAENIVERAVNQIKSF